MPANLEQQTGSIAFAFFEEGWQVQP